MDSGSFSFFIVLPLLFATFAGICESFSLPPLQANSASAPVASSLHQDSVDSRRGFLNQGAFVLASLVLLPKSPVMAADDVLPTKEAVSTAFGVVRSEIEDAKGGVAYMQGRIDAEDYEGLMEFTKGYDLELRKARMGKAKKFLQTKEMKEKGTEYANNVTFDLIGINRNSRKGKENQEGAKKYLQELRDDANNFLGLESSIATEG